MSAFADAFEPLWALWWEIERADRPPAGADAPRALRSLVERRFADIDARPAGAVVPYPLRQAMRLLPEPRPELARQRDEQPAKYLAKYAAAALLDQAAFGHDGLRDAWSHATLGMEMFNDANAGENLYAVVAELRRAKDREVLEVLEVYHACLALGFRGRHRLDDPERLRLIKELAELALDGPAGPLAPHGLPREGA